MNRERKFFYSRFYSLCVFCLFHCCSISLFNKKSFGTYACCQNKINCLNIGWREYRKKEEKFNFLAPFLFSDTRGWISFIFPFSNINLKNKTKRKKLLSILRVSKLTKIKMKKTLHRFSITRLKIVHFDFFLSKIVFFRNRHVIGMGYILVYKKWETLSVCLFLCVYFTV